MPRRPGAVVLRFLDGGPLYRQPLRRLEQRLYAPGPRRIGGSAPNGASYTSTQPSMLVKFTSTNLSAVQTTSKLDSSVARPAAHPAPPPSHCRAPLATVGPLARLNHYGSPALQLHRCPRHDLPDPRHLDTLPDSVLDLYAGDGETQLAENDYGASLASTSSGPLRARYVHRSGAGFSPGEQGSFSIVSLRVHRPQRPWRWRPLF